MKELKEQLGDHTGTPGHLGLEGSRKEHAAVRTRRLVMSRTMERATLMEAVTVDRRAIK